MGNVTRSFWRSLDAVDLTVAGGFACIVAGVAIRYDYALALIVFGLGLLVLGILAMRGR